MMMLMISVKRNIFVVTFFINWGWFLFQGNPRIIELSHIFLQYIRILEAQGKVLLTRDESLDEPH